MASPKIRIAQVVFGQFPGWPETEFQVEYRFQDPPRIVVVLTPDQARSVAEAMAEETGGASIYRGHLPDSWISQLGDYPRS